MKLGKGLVQVYTGNGKGKTTAALGLAVRAAGAGLGVYVLQFVKGKPYSEANALKKLKRVRFERCGRSCFIKRLPTREDFSCARKGLAKAREAIHSKRYDVVILDEANIALRFGLIEVKSIIALIKSKPRSVEIILTGRDCPPAVIRHADLVTEMKEIKHPYRRGIKARRGIEY